MKIQILRFVNYSKAYLHHLDKTNEMLGSMLASYHNIYYYHELMKQLGNRLMTIYS